MIFHLADANCANEFLRNPDYYCPILFGHDPMILLNEGRFVPGSTQFGLFEDKAGALFFASPESKAAFYRDFERNMKAIESIVQRAAIR